MIKYRPSKRYPGLRPSDQSVPQYYVPRQIRVELAELRRGGLKFLRRFKPKYQD